MHSLAPVRACTYNMEKLTDQIELLKRHNAHIKKVVPKERLLEMDLQDGWEPLLIDCDLRLLLKGFPRADGG